MREIVTVQVGTYANFVGSHFWNFQDELLGLAEDPHSNQEFRRQYLDMDVLYRAGETQQGISTYTPRVLSIGLQGSLGSMSSQGTLYNEDPPVSSEIPTWTGNISTQASEVQKKNLFLQSLYEEHTNNDVNSQKNGYGEIQDKDMVENLENVVQYWTDFSKVHYHPKSLYELNGLWVEPHQFDSYGAGKDAFHEGLRGEEMTDRLRFFLEDCDHIQGIQFIVDESGAYSGVAADFLENIADEYTNIPLLLYAVRPPHTHINPRSMKERVFQNLHDAVSFSRLSSFTKLIVPAGLPSLTGSKASKFLCINDEKPYHTSAIYASALHSLSLPFRISPISPTDVASHTYGALSMGEAIQVLSGQARQNMVQILDVSMPAPSLTGKHGYSSLLENLHALTSETAEDMEDMHATESVVVHGACGSEGHPAKPSNVKDAIEAAYEHASTRPRFSHLSVASCPLPIPLPFPSIFGNMVGQNGQILRGPISGCSQSKGSLDVHSIPMGARLRSSSAVLPFMENRLGNLRRFGTDRGAMGAEILQSWGFGKEDLDDVAETLSRMVMNLNPDLEGGSSDSD